jgi:hypothetical protein
MKKVVVKQLGVWDSIRRRPGAVFEIPDDVKVPSWCELVQSSKQVEALQPKKVVREEPTTFVELNKAENKLRGGKPLPL